MKPSLEEQTWNHSRAITSAAGPSTTTLPDASHNLQILLGNPGVQPTLLGNHGAHPIQRTVSSAQAWADQALPPMNMPSLAPPGSMLTGTVGEWSTRRNSSAPSQISHMQMAAEFGYHSMSGMLKAQHQAVTRLSQPNSPQRGGGGLPRTISGSVFSLDDLNRLTTAEDAVAAAFGGYGRLPPGSVPVHPLQQLEDSAFNQRYQEVLDNMHLLDGDMFPSVEALCSNSTGSTHHPAHSLAGNQGTLAAQYPYWADAPFLDVLDELQPKGSDNTTLDQYRTNVQGYPLSRDFGSSGQRELSSEASEDSPDQQGANGSVAPTVAPALRIRVKRDVEDHMTTLSPHSKVITKDKKVRTPKASGSKPTSPRHKSLSQLAMPAGEAKAGDSPKAGDQAKGSKEGLVPWRLSRTIPSFGDLVSNGLLQAGDYEFLVANVELVKVHVTPMGIIQWQGEEFSSISSFALAVVKRRNPDRRACDGWKEVRLKGAKLEILRQECLKVMTASGRFRPRNAGDGS